jgi:hypothetical protein
MSKALVTDQVGESSSKIQVLPPSLLSLRPKELSSSLLDPFAARATNIWSTFCGFTTTAVVVNWVGVSRPYWICSQL